MTLSDDQLLLGVPDYFSINLMLKASPSTEGADRFIYMEASNEGRDLQNERVMAKALAESADYYLRYGNVDLDHYTLLGRPNPALGRAGLPQPEQYEIGQPVAVDVRGDRTFVKARLYQGPAAVNANMVWDSMTQQHPAARWYPSVGGVPLAKSVQIDPSTGERTAVVERVRWTNIGLSRTPVNQHVPTAQVTPMGPLAKSFGFIVKGLESGYGTDSASLAGGAAMRKQSLYGAAGGRHPIMSYFDLRERLSGDLRSGRVKNPGAAGIMAHCVDQYGLSHDEAAEHTERFMRDLSKKRS